MGGWVEEEKGEREMLGWRLGSLYATCKKKAGGAEKVVSGERGVWGSNLGPRSWSLGCRQAKAGGKSREKA